MSGVTCCIHFTFKTNSTLVRFDLNSSDCCEVMAGGTLKGYYAVNDVTITVRNRNSVHLCF